VNVAVTDKRALSSMIKLGVLTGLWLIVAPFILNFTRTPAAMWNSIAMGIIIGLTAIARGTGRSHKQAGCNLLNVISSMWLIISPFVFGFYQHLGPLLNTTILGLILGLSVLAFWLRISKA